MVPSGSPKHRARVRFCKTRSRSACDVHRTFVLPRGKVFLNSSPLFQPPARATRRRLSSARSVAGQHPSTPGVFKPFQTPVVGHKMDRSDRTLENRELLSLSLSFCLYFCLSVCLPRVEFTKCNLFQSQRRLLAYRLTQEVWGRVAFMFATVRSCRCKRVPRTSTAQTCTTQEFPTRLRRKSVLQELHKSRPKASHKSVLQECHSEFLSGVCLKSVK